MVRVNHCHDAWGFVLRGSAGWKLVFSGDTRPSQRLCQAGAGATLLIHEATFEPAMHAQARAMSPSCFLSTPSVCNVCSIVPGSGSGTVDQRLRLANSIPLSIHSSVLRAVPM